MGAQKKRDMISPEVSTCLKEMLFNRRQLAVVLIALSQMCALFTLTDMQLSHQVSHQDHSSYSEIHSKACANP